MASQATLTGAVVGDEAGARTSSIPLLGDGLSASNAKPTPEREGGDLDSEPLGSPGLDSKTGKRRFWGLGKKKDDGKVKGRREVAVTSQPASTAVPASGLQSTSPSDSPKRTIMASPSNTTSHPYGTPTSPGRNMSSGSPHIPSPSVIPDIRA